MILSPILNGGGNSWNEWERRYYHKYDSSSDGLGLIYSKKFGKDRYLGIIYGYYENKFKNLYKSEVKNTMKELFENKTVYIYEESEENSDNSQLYNNYLTLGLILPKLEITGNYRMAKDKSKKVESKYKLLDEDPDEDGDAYWGGCCPNKIYALSGEKIKEDKELKTDYDIKMNFSRKFIVGISYNSYGIKGEGFKNRDTLDIEKIERWVGDHYEDVTLTTTSDSKKNIPAITGYEKEKSLFIKWGRVNNISDQTLFAYGIRINGGVDKIYKVKDKEITIQSNYTDSQDETQSKSIVTHYYSKEKEKFKIENFSLSLPFAIEKKVSDNLTIRIGIKKLFYYTKGETKKIEEKSETEKTVTTSEGTTTDILPPTTSTVLSTVKGSSSDTYYSFGLSYKVSEAFKIELVSFSDILNLGTWEVQAYWKF